VSAACILNNCNYSRILRGEEREDWWPHEIDQRVEDIAVLELGRFNDGGQRGIRVRAPFRAKPVGDLAMNHRGAEGPLASIVVGRDVRTMEKDEQMRPMLPVPFLQPAGGCAADPALEQCLEAVLHLRHPTGIPLGR
jgi:hypothetical protein